MRQTDHVSTDASIADNAELREVTEEDYVRFFKGLFVACVSGAIIYAVLILTVLYFV